MLKPKRKSDLTKGRSSKGVPVSFGDTMPKISRQRKEKAVPTTLSRVFPMGGNPYKLNDGQKEAMSFIERFPITLLYGRAGTGKSMLGVKKALELLDLQNSPYKKIIITRPIVATEDLGYLPGGVDEKTDPYLAPFYHFFQKLGSLNGYTVEHLLQTEQLEKCPIAYMRGANFDNCVVLIDECFPGEAAVKTTAGTKTFKELAENYENLKVLSFNEKTKQQEYKSIVKVWSNGIRKISKVKLGKKATIKATKNHKFLTHAGWKKLEELEIGDGIVSNKLTGYNVSALNDDQFALVIGSILGDGCLQAQRNNVWRMDFIQGISQKDYLEFKTSILNINIRYIEKNGYAQKPAVAASLGSFFSATIDSDSPKKWAIDNISLKSLAISWMDDGYYEKKQGHGYLYSCADNEYNNQLLSSKLNQMGYSNVAFKTKNGEGRVYWGVRFHKESMIKFITDIAPYGSTSMEYKFPNVNNLGTYEWNTIQENYSYRVVTEILLDIKECEVFDIEVEDNHNFFVSPRKDRAVSHRNADVGVLAHNCENCTPHQIKLILTRMGKDCKMIFTGDSDQCDLKKGQKSGIESLLALSRKKGSGQFVKSIELTQNERNPLIDTILQDWKELGY